MDNTPKYIYNNDLDKKYVNVKIVKNTEYYIFINNQVFALNLCKKNYIFIQLLKKIKKALLKK